MIYILLGVISFLAFAVLLKIYINGATCKIVKDLTGQIVVVTGSNTGIGRENVRCLAKMNATIIMACRSAEKTIPVMEQIKAESKNHNIFFMKLDMGSFKSVQVFANEFKSKYKKLDILIQNAGLILLKPRTTVDGFDEIFQVNYLSQFLLTDCLLDILKQSAPSRMIITNSLLHKRGKMNFDDLGLEKNWGGVQAYCNSKLYENLFAQEFARRYENTNIKIATLHPGCVMTDVQRNYRENFFFELYYKVAVPFWWYFTKTTWHGAQTNVHCSVLGHSQLLNGGYYSECRIDNLSNDAKNVDYQKNLWDKTKKILEEKGFPCKI